MTKNFLALFAFAILAGCSSSKQDEPPLATCDDRAKVDGVCPGVTSASVGTDGVTCTRQIAVANDGELAAKASSATAGSCLVLAAGSYGAVTLPAGVSLLGKGANGTSVEGIQLTGGDSATIRGVTVKSGGIVATGAGSLIVDRVAISHAKLEGINVSETNLTILASTIEGSGNFGVAHDAACTTMCMASPKLLMRGVLVRENHAVGVWAHGIDVELSGVQIESTLAQGFLFGRGLEVAVESGTDRKCSLKASSLAIVKSDEAGVLVDGCSVDMDGFVASNNTRGIQLQGIPDGAGKLSNFKIENNAALGLGVMDSKGIIVQGGRIASTSAMKIPVDVGGMQEVGDGLNWLNSDLSVAETVKIESSSRSPVIIDALSKGSFNGVLSGGDEAKGIIVQGGLTAVMPDGLSVGKDTKTELLAKDRALGVAVRVLKKKKD